MSLSLSVEPTAGTRIVSALDDAARIGVVLGLGWVSFKFNDEEFTVYPDGRALEFSAHCVVAEWSRTAAGRWRAFRTRAGSIGEAYAMEGK